MEAGFVGIYTSADKEPPIVPLDEKKFEFPELDDLERFLAGRESLPADGRESLGLLCSNFDNFVAPSIALQPVQEISFVDDEGRESLGILRHSFMDDGRESFGFVKYNCNENQLSVPTNILNMGFRRLSSAVSSISSVGSAFRPSLWSLDIDCDDISRIYSVKSPKDSTNSLNTAFLQTGNSNDNEVNCASQNKLVEETNILEMENANNIEMEIENDCNLQNEEIDEESNVLDDTVFLESRIVAFKIANKSILNDTPDDLNSTPLPDLIDTSFEEIQELPSNTDTVLKNVDKYFPIATSYATVGEEIITSEKEECAIVQNTYNGAEPVKNVFKNCSESIKTEVNHLLCVPNEPIEKLNSSVSPKILNSSRNSSSSRSRDAKDLLHNLSAIIDTETVTSQSEVKKILDDLANVLLVPTSKNDHNEDSGHSSIEENESLEDVDYQKFGSDEQFFTKPVDLSANVQEKRLSQSFCVSNTAKKIPGSLICSVTSNKDKQRQRSLDELDSLKKSGLRKLSIPTPKLRPKKNGESELVKKGPMKAFVPVGNMKRKSIIDQKKIQTSAKHVSTQSISLIKKRTSTPKTSEAAPMAQSTPELVNGKDSKNDQSIQYRGGKINSPMSPLSKSTLNNSAKVNLTRSSGCSGSAPNLNRSSAAAATGIPTIKSPAGIPRPSLIGRRRSASEITYNSAANRSQAQQQQQQLQPQRLVKSPLIRYSVGTGGGNENAHAGRSGGDKGVAEKVAVGRRVPLKSYLTERNRNLMQHVKPLNLLDKINK